MEKHTLNFLKKFLLCACLLKLIVFSSVTHAATNLNYNTASAANSDQYATGWRPYRPDIGRFTSLDPAGSPNGPNRYNYCGSEPVNHTDPTGLCPDCGHDSCLGDECHGDGVLRWKRTKPLLFWMDWNWEKRTNHDNAVDAHFRATVSQPAVQQHLDDATAIVVQTNVGKPVAAALGSVKGSVTLLVTGPLVVAKNTVGTYTYWITGYCRDAYEDNANLGLGLANTVAHPVDTFFNTMSEVSNSRNAYSAGDIFGSSTMSWYMMGRGAQSLTATGLSKLRSLVPANVAEFTENLRAAAGVETRLVEVESAAKTANIGDYRSTFFNQNPTLESKVVVHHAVEQNVLKRFPNVMTEAEIHSLENLRGIPNELNSDLHLRKIRIEWNRFYAPFDLNETMPTREQLLQKAKEIDAKYGSQFIPPVGGVQ